MTGKSKLAVDLVVVRSVGAQTKVTEPLENRLNANRDAEKQNIRPTAKVGAEFGII